MNFLVFHHENQLSSERKSCFLLQALHDKSQWETVINALLKIDIDINWTDEAGRTLLIHAAAITVTNEKDKEALIKIVTLLSNRSNNIHDNVTNQSVSAAFVTAVAFGNVAVVCLLIFKNHAKQFALVDVETALKEAKNRGYHTLVVNTAMTSRDAQRHPGRRAGGSNDWAHPSNRISCSKPK